MSLNMNNSNNTTTRAPTPLLDSNLFITILTYVDYVNRIVSMLIFLTYLVLVLKLKYLRHKSLLYVHHSNLTGFIFCVMYIFYFGKTSPSTSDPYLNMIFCVMSEVIWAMLKYLRTYSVLLIALYRLMAVFYVKWFKFINSSYVFLMIPILVVWVFSGVVFLATKYGFSTTYGNLFCIDGLGPTVYHTINYLVVTVFISIFMPYVLMVIIYVKIRRQLNKTEAKLNQQEGSQKDGKTLGGLGETLSNTGVELSMREDAFAPSQNLTVATIGTLSNMLRSEKPLKQKRRELQKTQRLNKQLIAVMICYLLSFSVAFVLNFRYIIPDFNIRFYYFRQILRILNVFFQSLIPVVSLYFNPHLSRVLKKALAKKKHVIDRNLINRNM